MFQESDLEEEHSEQTPNSKGLSLLIALIANVNFSIATFISTLKHDTLSLSALPISLLTDIMNHTCQKKKNQHV